MEKMGRVLIIGCGGVASVAIQKCCQNSEVFEEILIASRTKSKCDVLKQKLDGGKTENQAAQWNANKSRTKIQTAQLDADKKEEVVKLIKQFEPDLVMNIALPYQDLTIMNRRILKNRNGVRLMKNVVRNKDFQRILIIRISGHTISGLRKLE